jgi:hypothetical protein
MRVVELVVADAHLDGRVPLAALVAAIDGAERRDDGVERLSCSV